MKKIFFIVSFLIGAGAAMAQNIEEIRTYVLLNQFVKGKEAIDKFLTKTGNESNAEAWYYKAYIYNVVSRDSGRAISTGREINLESFNAVKKYLTLDPKAKLTKEENNSTIYNVYFVFYDFSIKSYNSKNYEESYANFTNALDVHDYIYSNKLDPPKGAKILTALDTDLVWNLVILGNELKKNNEVVNFYKRIIDANITDPKYLSAYEGIVLYYKEAKDQAHFTEYLEKGRKYFPDDQFWEAIDIEYATQGLTNADLFKKYDELTAKYPNSYVLFFNYGVELNRFVYSEEKSENKEAYKNKIPELFKKVISIKSTPDANMMLANYYYNNSFDFTEAATKIKGMKPDDVKKKNELITASKKALDDCIPYAEAAVDLFGKIPKLKNNEKVNYKQAYDMLIEIYRVKLDPKKSAEYKAKKEAIN